MRRLEIVLARLGVAFGTASDFGVGQRCGRRRRVCNDRRRRRFQRLRRLPHDRHDQNDQQPRNVESRIAFSTSRNQGLGDALPAGTVRFYQRDREGTPQFIGEKGIGHTPMGSDLSLVTGDAFDITIKAEVEKRETITSDEWEKSARYRVTDGAKTRTITLERPKTYYRTTMRYTLTNAKDVPVEVELDYGAGDVLAWLHRHGEILEQIDDGERLHLRVAVGEAERAQLARLLGRPV